MKRRRNVSCEVRTGFYIPEDGILHSHRRENLESYLYAAIKKRLNSGSFCYHSVHNYITAILLCKILILKYCSAYVVLIEGIWAVNRIY
jgi:hypothetical protein